MLCSTFCQNTASVRYTVGNMIQSIEDLTIDNGW